MQHARDAAPNARTTAEQSQAAIDAHAASIHNTDGAARTAAAAAQDRADNAFVLADEKVDAGGAATAAREVTADWAETTIPIRSRLRNW